MKTLTLAACACALLIGQPAVAAMDSTALMNPAVLGTNIQKSTSEIPVGTVIVWPAGSNPTDPENWLECDGRSVSQAKYPELYAVVGGRTPNYYNQFLRGGPSSQVGQVVADTTRNHDHNIQAHSHTVSGTASSQKVTVGSQDITGTAAGQSYFDDSVRWEQRWHSVTLGDTDIGFSNIWLSQQNRIAQSSAVTGKTAGGTYTTGGGTISGYTNAVSQRTDATGGAETAPQHTRVRYLIRALP